MRGSLRGHPSFDQRGLMRREIVEDHVDGEGGVHPLVDLAQKAHEIPRPMLLLDLRHDLAGRDVERREEVHRAMADVVVRLAFGPTHVHRQDRLRSLEGLNLRLFVE